MARTSGAWINDPAHSQSAHGCRAAVRRSSAWPPPARLGRRFGPLLQLIEDALQPPDARGPRKAIVGDDALECGATRAPLPGAAGELIGLQTHRWRELDSKFQFRATFGSLTGLRDTRSGQSSLVFPGVRFDALHGRELWIPLPVDGLRRLAQHGDLLSPKCRCDHPLHFKNDAAVLSAPVMPMSSSRAAEYSRCTSFDRLEQRQFAPAARKALETTGRGQQSAA